MVELVLHNSSAQVFELEPKVGASGVLPFDLDSQGALHRNPHPLHRQAALFSGLDFVAPTHDSGIDQHLGLRIGVQPEDEQPANDAHLRCGEADAVRVDHQRRHPPNEVLQVLVEAFDLPCRHAQRRVRILPDLGKRETPSGFRLGIELLVAYLSVLLGHSRSLGLEALRVDVDDHVQTRLAHRRCRGGQEPAYGSCDRSWMLRLRNQLCPEASTQTQKRGRP